MGKGKRGKGERVKRWRDEKGKKVKKWKGEKMKDERMGKDGKGEKVKKWKGEKMANTVKALVVSYKSV